MRYVGRTKVGKVKTNPTTELAIIRLPVDMKEKAGKYAHIWRVDKDTILIKFSNRKEIKETPSVHFGVHQVISNDLEERLKSLEDAVEELRKVILDNCLHRNSKENEEITPPAGFEPATIGLTGRRSTS